MAEFTGLRTIRVFEFDPSFALVNGFPVNGTGSPGDGIAFNHVTRNLVVVDGGSNSLIEVTTSGDFVRMISIPNAHVVGSRSMSRLKHALARQRRPPQGAINGR